MRILTILCVGLLLVLLLLGFFHPITDLTQDLGRHLLTGRLILQTHHVLKTNLFSYTYPHFPFLDHHWLSQVIFYLVFSVSGFNGLFLLKLILVALFFGLLLFGSLKKSSLYSVIFTSLLAFPVLFERTDIRPELFSFLLLTITVLILYYYRQKQTYLVFILIPLFAIWVNLHIYFFVGIGLFGLFVLDELIMHRKYLYNKHTIWFLSIFAVSCLATLLNPRGLTAVLYPLSVFQNYGYSIEENQTIFFLQNYYFHWSIFFFEVLTLLGLLSFITTFRKRHAIDWLILIAFAFFGASAVRNMPLFILAAFLPLSESFTDNFRALSHHFRSKTYLFPLSFTLLALLFGIFVATQAVRNGIGYTVSPSAERGVDFLLTHHITGRIFNNFDIGSYLIYRLYPDERVFVDGRPEAYPAAFFKNTYIPMQENPKLFDAVVKKYRISVIFFSHTDQTPWATTFLQNIKQDYSWQPVYLDDYAIIYLKKTAANRPILARFGMTTETLQATLPNHPTNKQLLQLAYFFDKTQEIPQAISIYQQLLLLDPTSCPALTRLAVLTSTQNQTLSEIYGQKAQRLCH